MFDIHQQQLTLILQYLSIADFHHSQLLLPWIGVFDNVFLPLSWPIWPPPGFPWLPPPRHICGAAEWQQQTEDHKKRTERLILDTSAREAELLLRNSELTQQVCLVPFQACDTRHEFCSM